MRFTYQRLHDAERRSAAARVQYSAFVRKVLHRSR